MQKAVQNIVSILMTTKKKSLIFKFVGLGFPGAQTIKNLPEMWVQSLGWKDSLEKDMATHSSILTWRLPMDREACGLQSMESRRVGHD